MEEVLKQILNEIKELKTGQQTLFNEMSVVKSSIQKIDSRLEHVEGKLDIIDGQQRENTDIIKAVLHNQEEFSAQLEALSLNTVSKAALENVTTKEDIGKLDARFQVLNARLFNQETEITQLKAVK